MTSVKNGPFCNTPIPTIRKNEQQHPRNSRKQQNPQTRNKFKDFPPHPLPPIFRLDNINVWSLTSVYSREAI